MEKSYNGAERLVIKVGTGFLFDRGEDGKGYVFLGEQMDALVGEVCEINKDREVAIVSSGAIGMAASRLGIPEPPKDNFKRAQLFCEGQDSLMHEYRARFEKYGKRCAQCLINRDDLDIRKRRRYVRKNQEGFFAGGIITIYNENGLTSIDEIKFGDNDILAAMLTCSMDADLLVMLSNPINGFGVGGGDSKAYAREILSKEERDMKILNGRYEKDESGIYRSRIMELLE